MLPYDNPKVGNTLSCHLNCDSPTHNSNVSLSQYLCTIVNARGYNRYDATWTKSFSKCGASNSLWITIQWDHTHVCCINNTWKHAITVPNLLRAQCMIYDAHWHIVVGTGADTQFSVTFLSWRTHFSKTHHYMAHVCDWHTIVEVYYSLTHWGILFDGTLTATLLCGTLLRYCEAHCQTIVRHTIVWHNSTPLWGTLQYYRVAHFHAIVRHTIVWHTSKLSWGTLLWGTSILGQASSHPGRGSSFPCPGNPHSSYHQSSSSSLEADFLSRPQWNRSQWTICQDRVIECCIACLCTYIEVNLLSVRLHRPKVTWGNTLRECTGWQMVHWALCNPQIFIFEMPSTSYQQTWPQIPPLQSQD